MTETVIPSEGEVQKRLGIRAFDAVARNDHRSCCHLQFKK